MKFLTEEEICYGGVKAGCLSCRAGKHSSVDEEQVRRSLEFIKAEMQPLGKINRERDSYNLKHRVEEWCREPMKSPRYGDYYVSNGAFIVAAIRSGAKVVQTKPRGINAYCGLRFIPAENWRTVAPFTRWLAKQVGRDDAVGDLAGEYIGRAGLNRPYDDEWPANSDDLHVFIRHVGSAFGDSTANDEVAIVRAWREFNEQRAKRTDAEGRVGQLQLQLLAYQQYVDHAKGCTSSHDDCHYHRQLMLKCDLGEAHIAEVCAQARAERGGKS